MQCKKKRSAPCKDEAREIKSGKEAESKRTYETSERTGRRGTWYLTPMPGVPRQRQDMHHVIDFESAFEGIFFAVRRTTIYSNMQ